MAKLSVSNANHDLFTLTLTSGKCLGILRINSATLAVFDKETGEGSVCRANQNKGIQRALDERNVPEILAALTQILLPDALQKLVREENERQDRPLNKDEIRELRSLLEVRKKDKSVYRMHKSSSIGYCLTKTTENGPRHWNPLLQTWEKMATECWRPTPDEAAAGSGVTCWELNGLS